MEHYERGAASAAVEEQMKTAVRIITVIALVALMTGGSALDGQNLVIPAAMIIPSAGWFGLIGWANR